MLLSTYLETPGAPSLTDLSARLGVSKGRLSQLRDATDWPPDLALKAEEETGGTLDASELSPIIARARQAAA
jgi:DNA-binding transcriptional regulator YdaS (Cro superfamily)